MPEQIRTLINWWKGEENLLNSVAGKDALWVIDGEAAYSSEGFSGNCFALTGDAFLMSPAFETYETMREDELYFENSNEAGTLFYVGDLDNINYEIAYNGSDIILTVRTPPEQTNTYLHYDDCFSPGNWTKINLSYNHATHKFTLKVNDNPATIRKGESDTIEPSYGLYGKLVFSRGNDGALFDEIKMYSYITPQTTDEGAFILVGGQWKQIP